MLLLEAGAPMDSLEAVIRNVASAHCVVLHFRTACGLYPEDEDAVCVPMEAFSRRLPCGDGRGEGDRGGGGGGGDMHLEEGLGKMGTLGAGADGETLQGCCRGLGK